MFFGKIWGSSSEKILLKSLKTYDLIHSEKVFEKQEKHGLINVEALRIIKIWKKEKKNADVWSEIIQPNTRSRDHKTQKLLSCNLKEIGLIHEIANPEINL